jgi:hypothetical protein
MEINTFTSCFILPSDFIYAFGMILSISRECFTKHCKMAGHCNGDVVCFCSKAEIEFFNKIQTRFMFIILIHSILLNCNLYLFYRIAREKVVI